jgi:hypothetical protein
MPLCCVPFQKNFCQELLLYLVENTKQEHVLPILTNLVFFPLSILTFEYPKVYMMCLLYTMRK